MLPDLILETTMDNLDRQFLMEGSDVVDTSDVEERELFSLSNDTDHQANLALAPIKGVRVDAPVASPQSATMKNSHRCGPDPLSTSITRHGRSSDHEADSPSPRKRIKVGQGLQPPSDIDVSPKTAHNAGAVSLGSACSVAFEASFPKVVSKKSVSPLISGQSPERMVMSEDERQPPMSFPPCSISPRSDWYSLFSSPGQPSVEHKSPDVSQAGTQWLETPSTPPLISRPLLRSLSDSIDHHSVFSSPRRHPTTPPQTSSQGLHDRSSAGGQERNLLASSPLTPVSSPPFVAPILSQSPDPLRLPPWPLETPRPLVSLPAPHPVRSLPVEIPEDSQPPNRYSLRRREARQLNPYAYDNLLYKQQLKFHPDAIVKFRSRGRNGSSVAGQDDTQDGFVPPDDPDEDADYVDVEGGSNWRVQRSDRRNELDKDDQPLEVRQMDEDRLPGFLKGLSSSDEGDNEIRKLVKKIRSERERAKAFARADVKKAAAKAKKVTKRIFQPFPVHEDVDHRPIHTRGRVSPSELSFPLSLFPRAQSEPPAASYPPSLTQSLVRPPALPRMYSLSPVSGSRPLESPDFGIYMQQDRFNDHVPLFLRNVSPVDQPVTCSAPPSPVGPPTTSGVSAPQSNASRMDSESDQQSTLQMSSKDRKRLKALRRMMPAAMIARQLGTTKVTQAPPSRPRAAVESSGSEAEEVRVIPGLARVRKGRYRNAEVRGDPESSDVEHPTEVYDDDGREDSGFQAMEMLSDGQSAIGVGRPRRASSRVKREDDVISLSDSSTPGSPSGNSGSNNDSDDEEAHRSLFERSARGPARERSLIDWMLSRTGGSGKPKSKSKRSRSRKSRGSRASKLNVVTSGARRYGVHHQALLPFSRVNTSSGTPSSTKHDSEHRDRTVQDGCDTDEGKKRGRKWKWRSGIGQGPAYNVRHDGTRITSRHREGKAYQGRAALVIEHDDNEFRQALDPGWKTEVERWNKPVSPARQPAPNSVGTSALTAPRPRLYRQAAHRLQNEIPLPFYFQREDKPFASIHRYIVIDMNIIPLPSGIKFGPTSYTEKGFLHRLISVASGHSDVSPPIHCDVQGFEIGPTTSAAVFSALLGPLCDRLLSALRDSKADDVGTLKEWEFVTRASNQLLSWLAVHAIEQEFVALEVALREYLDGLLLALESLETNTLLLTAYWFVVELSVRLAAGIKYRRGSAEDGYLIETSKQLIRRLLGVDLRPVFTVFRAAEPNVDVTLLSHRAAELWVCLIYLLPTFSISLEVASGHPLWHFLADLYSDSSPTGPEASEDLWRTIFCLCALSQFSILGLSTSLFRLPAAWELVAAALKKIVLTVNPPKDCQLPQRALKKRDDYVSCVVSRCFLLWSQWGWHLDDGIAMFKSLQEIFRSRNFANLLNERSAPMGFLEHGDLELLSKRDPHDTVFEVFLKMVVQAVHLLNRNDKLDPKLRSSHIRKLLQMAVPVSPVPFSRSAPPSAHSLSMLVNRFNAMAVAIHLDPVSVNVKFRVGQARRCVSFKDADDQSRVACVYGMMNFAIIARHHKITRGLEEVLGWLTEMADVLMDEYKEGETSVVRKKSTTTLIQLLIGSVRRVTETQSLDKGQSRAEYPDPTLLDGPWVTRVFNPRTDLITIQQTGVEIRMLVQSFLDARLKALPDVQLPPPPVLHGAESQESQDEYDKLSLDLNDEELLAALGNDAEASVAADLKSKEVALCKVLDKSITPAVYRLVCKHFGESEHAKNDATSNRAADEWIDCWVGCANVLVQNGQKDWGLYTKLGQQSWEKIIDDSWRRRVGLRFNLTLLRLDPGAYSKMKDDFMAVLLVATLSHKTTIEHEFISVVLSLDGLQHPLLRAAPIAYVPATRKYEISAADYEVARGQLIETIFANTAGCLRARVDAESQGYVELVVMMLSTMRSIYESVEVKEQYGEFCRRVFGMTASHLELVSHPRLSGVLEWGRREWNV